MNSADELIQRFAEYAAALHDVNWIKTIDDDWRMRRHVKRAMSIDVAPDIAIKVLRTHKAHLLAAIIHEMNVRNNETDAYL